MIEKFNQDPISESLLRLHLFPNLLVESLMILRILIASDKWIFIVTFIDSELLQIYLNYLELGKHCLCSLTLAPVWVELPLLSIGQQHVLSQ